MREYPFERRRDYRRGYRELPSLARTAIRWRTRRRVRAIEASGLTRRYNGGSWLRRSGASAADLEGVGMAKRGENTGRSGGVVDAPGKKRRKPLPSDPQAKVVKSQAEKMRTAMPMAKTNRRRGRA
jgi:hypothetical protein